MDRSEHTDSLEDILDYREFFFKILNNWYYFLLSIFVSLLIAFAYSRYSKELYQSSTKIKIDKSDEVNDFLLNNISDNKITINDEIKIFSSYPLVFQTLQDLRFDISYFDVGNVKNTETIVSPYIMSCDLIATQKNTKLELKIETTSETTFVIGSNITELNGNEYSFNQNIQYGDYNFSISLNNSYDFSDKPPILIRFNNLKQLSKKYQRKIQFSKIEKESNIISLFILEEDQRKGVLFLNKLVENYINNDINKRKLSSLNTVDFISKEIKQIEDSLEVVEIKLQEYKNLHNIPDINLKTQKIYSSISEFEKDLSEYKYQEKYYIYLEDYLNEGNYLDRIIVPSTYGISNPSLTDLIRKLVDVQIEKDILVNGGQIDNPSIEDFNLKIVQLSKNIKELINNSKQTNANLISDLSNKISIAESSLEYLPVEQRELLNIERMQKTSESLYTFLLQKKLEAEISASSITSNVENYEPAVFLSKSPKYPNSKKIYSISLFIGLIFPLIVLLILDLFNNKIRSRIELTKITKLNLIGVIGRNHSANILLHHLNPKSSLAEGFRALRSNLNHLNNNLSHKVYLLTSSISGEGKTFIASNLASVFSNSGKKTLLLGADLRKPKLYKDFSSKNNTGLSTILDGKSLLEDTIVKYSDQDNLDIIFSGPLPENPSDMFLRKEFVNLMERLKEKYDKIVIDTAPIGLVADAFTIMKYTDVNLYVVRQNYTDKDVIRFVNDLHETKRVSNLHLILNDVVTGTGVYGYGKYSYGYGDYLNDSKYFNDKNES